MVSGQKFKCPKIVRKVPGNDYSEFSLLETQKQSIDVLSIDKEKSVGSVQEDIDRL